MRARHVLPIAVAALALTAACTPEEAQHWLAWHRDDPAAAQAWLASPDGQASLVEDEPPAEVEAPPSGRVAMWDDIAWCESGGNWSHGPVTNSSGTYSGGLMIGHRWWGPNGGNAYASAPYLASKAQQIAVAENIAADIGVDRGWQCYP